MKRQLLLYVLVFILLVVNGIFLFMFMSGDSPNRKQGPPGDFIVQELNFSASQMEEFRLKSRQHHDKMRRISNDIRATKKVLFDRISDETLEKAEIDSLTSRIGDLERKKDTEVFYHFRSIESICDDEQKLLFGKLIKDALHKVGKHPPPRRPH